MMRLAYVALSRLPTENAHGFQIAKMCEAFSELGLHVDLIHPFRIQPSSVLQEASFSEYYGLRSPVRVTTVRGTDVIRLRPFMPGPAAQVVFSAFWFQWSRRIVRHLLDLSIDCCFTREPVVAWWAQRYGLATVLELHREPKRLNRVALLACLRSRRLRGIVTMTDALRRRVERLTPVGCELPVISCPDAVDLRSYEDLPDRAACRRRLGLPQDRRIIGYIGRFRSLGREKGVPELIRAVPHLAGAIRRQSLVLCVGGPMEVVPHYEQVAGTAGVAAGEVRFVDHVPPAQVPLWIRACDVVTIPWPRTEYSEFFTSPLKMFEYMAAEVPIVASDLESLREVLRHEETALLAEPGSPAALAREIGRLLTDAALARTLSANARQRVEQYTWRERARTIHQQLLSSERHRRVAT